MTDEFRGKVGMVDELGVEELGGGKLMMWKTMQLNDNILVMKRPSVTCFNTRTVYCKLAP
jgi:hypothetical protein